MDRCTKYSPAPAAAQPAITPSAPKCQGERLYVGPGWIQDDVVHQDLAASFDFDGDVGRVDAQEVQAQSQPRAGLNQHRANLKIMDEISLLSDKHFLSFSFGSVKCHDLVTRDGDTRVTSCHIVTSYD